MLNKPKFMSPSTNMQIGTIDVTESVVPFSCVIDGSESIVAWKLIIYNLNNGTEVFNSDKVALSTPLYPIDERGRNVTFSINLKEYLDGNTTFINQKEAYSWTISFWGNSGGFVTSCEEVFYATKKPSVSITFRETDSSDFSVLTNSTVLSGRNCTFKGSYLQDNGVQIKKYGWRLIDTDNKQTLVDTITHNQIYGIADNIICSYNGFLSDGHYSIELYIETQDRTELKTETINFSSTYNTTLLDNSLKVNVLSGEPGVILDWNDAVIVGGRCEGLVEFKENYPIVDYSSSSPDTSVKIPSDSKVVFDQAATSKLNLDETCYITLSTQLLDARNTDLFLAEGVDDNGLKLYRRLSFENGKFKYTVIDDNEIILTDDYTVINKPSEYVWYIILMSPILTDTNGGHYTKVNVVESKVVDALYPSPTLYPTTSLYPTFGNWDKLKEV